jgi:hypothetical protein
MTKFSNGNEPTSRRSPLSHRVRQATITTAAVALLSLAGSAAYATTTVVPNPVAPGGSITVTPDTTCIDNAVGGVYFWRMFDSIGAVRANTQFQSAPTTFDVPVTPGTYALVVQTGSSSNPPLTGCTTTVVVSTTPGVPLVAQRPLIAVAAITVSAAGLRVARRRRRPRVGAGI